MDVTEENVQMLLNMGFDELDIRRALKIAKNDLSEAVAILTNDHPVTSFDTLQDVEMKPDEIQPLKGSVPPISYGPSLPPSYEQSIETGSVSANVNNTGQSQAQQEENNLEFPVANFFELENRVFTESWSIPYKREESLGRCLISATRLAAEGLSDSDQHCNDFMTRCLPDAFQKLLSSGAVLRWGFDIQEGIYDMLQLLIELAAARLQHSPIPVPLLHVLGMAFNPDTEYHQKNRRQESDSQHWEDVFGDKVYAISPQHSSGKDPYGWLTNLVNMFAEKKGFHLIHEKIATPDLDAPSLAALLEPIGNCAEFLNPKVVKDLMSPALETAMSFVKNLTENDLKEKRVGVACDMLATMKLICLSLWSSQVLNIDEQRLEIVLRMLKSQHYNARMNALKEVTKLIEDSSGAKSRVRSAIDGDIILDWMVERRVLSIALEGNIDHAQYTDKIKNIVEFLGPRLSVEELSKIWKMQVGERNVVIDNIHTIIAAAGVKFNAQQLEHLFILVQKSWEVEKDKMREKLLHLIGKIGREACIAKTTNRVLELLWDLAHLPSLPTHLVELALQEHLSILNEANGIKEQVKRSYIDKCVDDIKEGKWVLPALRQLHLIVKNIARQKFTGNKVEKGILQEINKNYDIIKQVTNRLVKFHQMAVLRVKDNGSTLSADLVIDFRYTHKDHITAHLSFLQFVLQEGMLYLPWNRARDIWSTLMTNSDACIWDRETCFEWFTKGISDMEHDTQSQLFQKEILKLDPGKVTLKGFTCFKCFFENVNMYDHRLKKTGTTFTVEKPELIGMDFLWEVCLNTQDTDIAASAISLLMHMSYTSLTPRLKRDPIGLHRKFIDECYNRLDVAMIPLGKSAVAQVLSSVTTLVTAVSVPDFASMPSPSRSANMLNIERLLLIAERYIVTVEELHTAPRTILPHGASFQGQPLAIHVICESTKSEFTIQAHTNETVGSFRHKVATNLKHSVDTVQIVANDKMLTKDHKLLQHVGLEDHSQVTARTYGSGSSVSSVSTFSSSLDMSNVGTAKQSFDLEQEKVLPGVVMATGGQVFEMLYLLAGLDEPRITTRARNLLKLIPTDPSVQDSLEKLGQKVLRQSSPDDISPRTSPRTSPRKFSPNTLPATSTSSNSKVTNCKDGLKSLFDASSSGISSFRVLYNLEVLSSKLVPTVRDPATRQSTRRFCEDFLNAGGLSLVVNVLQKEAISSDVDYETRQGCYAIVLQLLRFLLCGEDVAGETVLPKTSSNHQQSSAAVSSLSGSGAVSGTPSLEITPAAASRAVQTMGVNDFKEMVACFTRVAWAAAAGKLHLVSSSQPIKESSSLVNLHGSSRSRQSSTGSTASTGSDSEPTFLHPGVCVKQTSVSTKDANIACEALGLLVTCLQLRSQLIVSFFNLPYVNDFVIDVLVGSTTSEVRDEALRQFYAFSETELPPGDWTGHQQRPHHFMLQILLKARLPFWVSSSNTRGASHRLLKQCTQYFDLRCKLLSHLEVDEQKRLQIDVGSMLEDEVAWLSNFTPSERTQASETDNKLIAGHLRLIRCLLSCSGVDKEEYGKTLVQDLLHEFLFPSSKLIMQVTVQEGPNSMANYVPKCSTAESRTAAYELLSELADGSIENLREICLELISMHHLFNPELATEWEYMPPVDSRSSAGFVGLKNGGATCYMNSVLQQLFLTPTIADTVLAVDDDGLVEESVLYQMQQLLGHLMESRLQYYVPETFWKVFKLWGQPVNIREQQDAFDFYTSLIDQLDEQMKKLKREEIFKKKFQGAFLDQKICKDCPHRYETEEIFFALNVTVKNATLQDSLDQFVKGELLEGDNAYFCEKCGEKRNTIKRMCIKTLPPVLCIQLKRFDYDWEANRALKFDDHFKFPLVLDMEPYTADGMARQEELENQSTEASSDENDSTLTINAAVSTSFRQINYELVGVVVHSGQANAGHYYSFIKDRRGEFLTNPERGKWFKFNDTVVEEFEMSDSAIENECFGGKYRPKLYDQSNNYAEERMRYWNGYLLFYDRVEETKTPISAKKSKVSLRKLQAERASARGSRSDSLVELTELVHKGEKRGLFTDKMPARVQQVVREENLRFMKNRDVYDQNYFAFVRKLVTTNINHTQHAKYQELCVQSLEITVNFLFNTYYRTKKKLRMDLDDWEGLVSQLLQQSQNASIWMVDYLAGAGSQSIKAFLLECPTKEIRVTFSKMLGTTISSFFQHGGVPTHKCVTEVVETVLSLLVKDVPEHIKNCAQYHDLLNDLVKLGTKACSLMFGRHAFPRLVQFLIGPGSPNQESEQPDDMVRRWSSVQAQEFGHLHATLATLVLNTDISPYRTEAVPSKEVQLPKTVTPGVYLKMSPNMHRYVFGSESSRYIREVVLSLREVSTGHAAIEDFLVYASFANWPFSIMVLKHIMHQYPTAPSNEQKATFQVLMQILLMEDSLQLKRLTCVIDGYVDQHDIAYDGMLSVIKSNHQADSRRSYQCIKFLVNLANHCALAKDYLMQSATKWQWAVNWLKKKMTEYTWASGVTSNEDISHSSKSFQRTISAQDTLAEATALLTELESHDSPIPEVLSGEGQDMDISNSESTELSAQTPPRSTPSTVLQQSQQDGNSSPDNSSIDESDSKTSQRL